MYEHLLQHCLLNCPISANSDVAINMKAIILIVQQCGGVIMDYDNILFSQQMISD